MASAESDGKEKQKCVETTIVLSSESVSQAHKKDTFGAADFGTRHSSNANELKNISKGPCDTKDRNAPGKSRENEPLFSGFPLKKVDIQTSSKGMEPEICSKKSTPISRENDDQSSFEQTRRKSAQGQFNIMAFSPRAWSDSANRQKKSGKVLMEPLKSYGVKPIDLNNDNNDTCYASSKNDQSDDVGSDSAKQPDFSPRASFLSQNPLSSEKLDKQTDSSMATKNVDTIECAQTIPRVKARQIEAAKKDLQSQQQSINLQELRRDLRKVKRNECSSKSTSYFIFDEAADLLESKSLFVYRSIQPSHSSTGNEALCSKSVDESKKYQRGTIEMPQNNLMDTTKPASQYHSSEGVLSKLRARREDACGSTESFKGIEENKKEVGKASNLEKHQKLMPSKIPRISNSHFPARFTKSENSSCIVNKIENGSVGHDKNETPSTKKGGRASDKRKSAPCILVRKKPPKMQHSIDGNKQPENWEDIDFWRPVEEIKQKVERLTRLHHMFERPRRARIRMPTRSFLHRGRDIY